MAALDEYLADLAQRATTAAVDTARRQGTPEVNAGQLYRALAEIGGYGYGSRTGRPSSARYPLTRILGTLYVAIGLLVMLLSWGIVMMDIRLFISQDLAQSLFLVGGVLAVFGYSFPTIFLLAAGRQSSGRASRTGSASDSVVEFLTQWGQFERSLKSVSPQEGLEDTRRVTLSQRLAEARKSGALTDEETRRVRELLSRRNDIVHGGTQQAPEALESDTVALVRLTNTLRSRAEFRA